MSPLLRTAVSFVPKNTTSNFIIVSQSVRLYFYVYRFLWFDNFIFNILEEYKHKLIVENNEY